MATYKIKGDRFVRSYRAAALTPSYAAPVDASVIAQSMCDVPWERALEPPGGFPAHAGNDRTDAQNVASRRLFDAYEFCAEHADGVHRAYAGAACYRFALPAAAVGLSMTSLRAAVSCDPYCRDGARIAVFTKNGSSISTVCDIVRKGKTNDDDPEAQSNDGTDETPATVWTSTNTHAEGVAPRRAESGANGAETWYPNSGTAVVSPEGALVLGNYLYVFVTLENYEYARQGYLEGAARVSPTMEIELAEALPDVEEGATLDCTTPDAPDGKVIETTFPALSVFVDGQTRGFGRRIFPAALDWNSGREHGFVMFIGGNGGDGMPSVTIKKPVYGATTTYVYNYKMNLPDVYVPVPGQPAPEYPFTEDLKRECMDFEAYQTLLAEADVTQVSIAYGWFYVTTKDKTMVAGIAEQFLTSGGALVDVNLYPTNHPFLVNVDPPLDLHGGGDIVTWPLRNGRPFGYPVKIEEGRLTSSSISEPLHFVGRATGVGFHTDMSSGKIVLAGEFESVGGVPVKNLCVVDVSAGGFRVEPVAFDGLVTPNHADGLRVVYNGALASNPHWFFTGSFTRLGNTACPTGSATVAADGTVTPLDDHYVDAYGNILIKSNYVVV